METLREWQDLMGAIIGASAAFILWWCAEKYRQYRERKERLYYIHRIIVDQINGVLETKRTILEFIKNKLNPLIETPRSETENQYSVDLTFFPLFAATALNDSLHRESTGSVYVDNKLAQTYKISQDLPLIIEDLRKQFHETLNFNREISFNKLNPAASQRITYLSHLRQYRSVLREEMLGHNIPTYLKLLTEVLVAIIEFRKISRIRWRFRFEAHFKFFKNKGELKEFRESVYDRIEKKFEEEATKQLEIFSKMTKDEIIVQVKTLDLPKGSYIVFGAAPMALAGIREAGDIDLLVSPELFAQLKQAGWKEFAKMPNCVPLQYDCFEAHDTWDFSPYSPTLEQLLATATVVDGVPFASLDEVRKWKAASGGPKNLADVELIDKYLQSMKA